ncbi:MAG: L-histidine N(alpha)-methyltransferase [Candidatus Acidiferrales bacterium]
MNPSVHTRFEPEAGFSLEEFARDVRAGLSCAPQKELPSKYFYDEVGSALFEAICALPEYGLSRAGNRLLELHAEAMVSHLRLPAIVAELGSGSGKQTRWLLEALSRLQPVKYFPIDISRTALRLCHQELGHMDSVSIVGFERLYLDGLLEAAARRQPGESLLVLFLGSTIGNFDRPAGEKFLRQIRRILFPGDSLLLATDLLKPVEQLLRAYDDPAGVTAAFNRNLLARMNRELEANFDLSRFRHEARWNANEARIEMHLRSLVSQRVTIPRAHLEFTLSEDESIWTESSHKFDCTDVVRLGKRTGYRCIAQWVDQEWPFAQSLMLAA